MQWEQLNDREMRSDTGYRVVLYRFSDGRIHYEAWPPKKRERVEWPDCYEMLGIKSRSPAARKLCEQHAKGEGQWSE